MPVVGAYLALGGWERSNPGIFVLDTDGQITHKQFHESYRVRDTGAGTLAQPTSCRTVTISRSGGNDDGLPSRARLAEIDHPSYWVRQRNIGKTLAFFWPDLSEIPRWKRHRHPPRPRSRWQTHVGPAVETLVFRHRIHFVCAM